MCVSYSVTGGFQTFLEEVSQIWLVRYLEEVSPLGWFGICLHKQRTALGYYSEKKECAAVQILSF